MQLVQQSETEWLELKASIHPKGGVFDKGTNADDYYWHVAKAVIALANSIGGVLLLGVTDDGGVIGIEASDPKRRRQSKGAEAFRREVVMQKLLLPPKGWKTGQQGTFQLVNAALLERLVALEEIPDGEQTVLAIFVDPAPAGYGFVEVKGPKDASPVTYVRERGAVGRVRELLAHQPDVLTAHEAQRQELAAEIGLVWKRFEESGQLARPAEELLPDVRRNVTALEARLAQAVSKFIPLAAVQRRGRTVADVGGRRRAGDVGDSWARSGGRDLLRTKPKPRRGPATEFLRQSRRALLVGEGGSGKSRCLAAFALDAARNWQPGRPWPLLISLSAFTAEGLAGLLEAESGIDWQELLKLIDAGELTLCLDGLNECPDQYYAQCMSEIAGLLREYPAVRVLLTSRTSQLAPDLQLEILEIEPMDRACQGQFLEAYLEQPQKAEPILEQLHLHAGGSAIAGSPMLLRIAAEVARETDKIPNERSALYRRFLDAWFRREVETARRGGQSLPWGRELTFSALAELAFQTRQKGSSRIPLDHARDILIHRLGEDTQHFIDWASQGTVLVRNSGRGDLVFEHETIQEYLCAEYLVARHDDLHSGMLSRRADAKPGIWAMPLAFTFEMLAHPSAALVDAAWRVEPLIVAAGTRNSLPHRAEELADDLWLQAVLNVLLGKDASAQARAISIVARLPPKYPISPYLLTSLNSRAFWYSASTHAAGAARVERLRNLICGTDFPWIELLQDALVGCDAWGDGLSPALRAIVGVSPAPTLSEVLSSATVSELCALRRRKMISAETFVSSWKPALDRSSEERRDIDLLDILRTEKDRQRDDILKGMLPRYQAQLRRIAYQPDLSLRLLSILLRYKVVSAAELRQRPGFLENTCARMSMMNAIRLAKKEAGLLRRADIDAKTRARLVYDRKTTKRNIEDAIKHGLLDREDLPMQLREQIAIASPLSSKARTARLGSAKFSAGMLSVAKSRQEVTAELAKKRWKVVLQRIPLGKGFGFVRHPDFDRDIFCLLSRIASPDRNMLREGKELDVRITASFDERRQQWGFAVESGRCT
ncbi:RNA-binding domain-containing protein [Thioclava sp.]|uniref:RNA-binding domain-containing protein n=1 Tax=Thioclava sp. TaxID=1933450 RepID=UPI003AA8B042